MAHIDVHGFTAFGLDFEEHTATSYQIAKDENFERIIDQSLYDVQNKLVWYSMLPKLPEDGGVGYYADLNNLYARIKLHFGPNVSSPWLELKKDNQNVQNYVLTQDNREDKFTTSKELGHEDLEAIEIENKPIIFEDEFHDPNYPVIEKDYGEQP